jgi:hypothetical protein
VERSRIHSVAIATAQAKGAFLPSSQAKSCSVCSFLRIHHRGFGSASYLLPHLDLTLTLTLFSFSSSSLSSSSSPTHTINPHHSTICFLHSLALTVGSLISIQSSRQITLVTPSSPAPLQLPPSNQPYSSGFVQVCLPDPVLSCKPLPKQPGSCTALHIYTSLLITMLTLICSDFPSLQRTQLTTYLIPTASINGKPPPLPPLTSSVSLHAMAAT